MKRISLHALLCLALLFAVGGCTILTSRPAERTQFRTPQTGSNIGQRVTVRRTTRQQVQPSAREQARQAEQAKKRQQQQQKREARAKKRGTEVADPDFVPRGGFR